MIPQKRFGRKVPLPSTIEIKRDLMIMRTTDALIDALDKQHRTDLDLDSVIANLTAEYHISPDRAQMLVNRFDRGKVVLSSAGQDREARKHRCGIQ